MSIRRLADFRHLGLSAGLLALVVGVPALAQPGDLAMLTSLAKGGWTVRERDDGAQRKICVRDGRELIQLRHPQPNCSRFVVTDAPDHVVVQYTCRGNGYGRTDIRRESGGLLQIKSQGFIDGAPFSVSAEARHTGAC
jgi:hypothetical protein